MKKLLTSFMLACTVSFYAQENIYLQADTEIKVFDIGQAVLQQVAYQKIKVNTVTTNSSDFFLQIVYNDKVVQDWVMIKSDYLQPGMFMIFHNSKANEYYLASMVFEAEETDVFLILHINKKGVQYRGIHLLADGTAKKYYNSNKYLEKDKHGTFTNRIVLNGSEVVLETLNAEGEAVLQFKISPEGEDADSIFKVPDTTVKNKLQTAFSKKFK